MENKKEKKEGEGKRGEEDSKSGCRGKMEAVVEVEEKKEEAIREKGNGERERGEAERGRGDGRRWKEVQMSEKVEVEQ